MTDFIEGAAYVSPSRNQLWTTDQIRIAQNTGVELPDDLVMIWAPGYEIEECRPLCAQDNRGVVIYKLSDDYLKVHIDRQKWGLQINEGARKVKVDTNEWGAVNMRVPTTVTQIFNSNPAVDPVVKRDQSGTLVYQHPKTRGWFYPTRYNETPGLYEDELENPEGFGNRWEYRDADPSGYGDAAKSWLEVDTGTWHAVPNDGASAVAVQWRCKLDA